MTESPIQDTPASVQLEFPEPLKPRSKYTFENTPAGFTIHREGGISLPIVYRDTSMWIEDGQADVHHGLYGDDLLNAIADRLIELTMGRNRRVNKSDRAEAKDMFTRALGRRVTEAMNRVRAEIAPADVVELARKLWASNHTDAQVVHLEALYTDQFKHLRSDLLKYHACRLYAKYVEQIKARDDDFLPHVSQWREVLGESSQHNRAINKTLDHFPVGVSFHQIFLVSQFDITTPITTRLHMVACLCAAEHHHWDLHKHTVLKADDEQVLQASAVQGAAHNRRTKTEFLRLTMNHIMDYEEAYHGDLVGLSRRSLHWHANLSRNHRAQRSRNEPTARPAIDLEALAEAGITFLDSANAVIDEGALMDHCVASYADTAVAGGCYLFHVDFEGHMATIEATPAGKVIQAYGPRDTKNPACGHGEKLVDQAFEKAKTPTATNKEDK